MRLSRQIVLILLSALGCIPLATPLLAQDAARNELAPVPPPQNPVYYLNRYGLLGVPATIHNAGKVETVVILGRKNEKGILEGVDHNGNIRYRPTLAFDIEAQPSYGYRFSGNGYTGESNPILELQVGHSYIFNIKNLERYPMIIDVPNPNRSFEKIKYSSFEVLNNGSDLNAVRFSPSPDTLGQLGYLNQSFPKMKGQITINYTPVRDDQFELIYQSVSYRRPFISQYLSLLAKGFIARPSPLGSNSLMLYNEILDGFKNGANWYKNLTVHEEPGYSLFMLYKDPAAMLANYKFSRTFPRPEVVAEQKIYLLNALKKYEESSFLLLKVRTREKEAEAFIRRLIHFEALTRPEIKTILQNPALPDGFRISEAKSKMEVRSKRSLSDFEAQKEGFDQLMERFKNLSITYAINTDRFQEARGYINDGDFARGLHLLRPIVYPVIKLAPIPRYIGQNRISNFQDHVEFLLETLIQAAGDDETPANYKTAYTQEAFTIIYILPLFELDNNNFILKALDVVGLLARTGLPDNMKRAHILLNIIPFDKRDEDMVTAFFRVAGDFRSAGYYNDALGIYDQFLPLKQSPYFREACLWGAFCRASTNPPAFGASELFLEQFLDTYKTPNGLPGAPGRDESIYSLWRLIEALLAFKDPQDRLEEAMDKVSEAVVFSRIGYSWVPEILSLSAQCYEKKGKTEVARNVYHELKIFYPKHPKTRQFEIEFPKLVGN